MNVTTLARLLAVTTVLACAPKAGGPLKYTFDGTKLAAVPLDAKQNVTQAQQQHDVAVAAHAKATEDYRDAEVEQEVAEYQAAHALVVSQLVAARLASGQQSPDGAALARKTADAKVEFERARRVYLAKLALSSHFAAYSAQAKLELERARVAQQSNLTTAGFDIKVYEQQDQSRADAARAAQAETDKERQIADAKLTAWRDVEKQFMQASAMKGPAESERAAMEWKQPEPAPRPSAPPPADEPAAQKPAEPPPAP